MTEQEELSMLKSARCVYVGQTRTFIASARIAGKRRRVIGSTLDGAFTLLALLSLTACPPTSAPVDAAETPDALDDDAHQDIDAPYRDDAWADDAHGIDATYRDDARELADDVTSEDAPFICTPEDACPPGYTWTVCGCATDCLPPACGADQ